MASTSIERQQIAELLRAGRIKRGLSQEVVAKKLGYRSGQFISNMERGHCLLPLKKLRRLVELYGLDRDEVYHFLLRMRERELRDGLGMPN